MKPTKQLKAWRLQQRLKPILMKINKDIMKADPPKIPALVSRYDTIQRRIDIVEKYLNNQ